MASNFEGANGGLSMLEKSLERRRVNKEHNSNFRAGHVPVNEEHLHKTGLRGRKRFFAYIILALVFVAALANLGMTIMIMLVLNINWDGLESMTFLSNSVLKFDVQTDIDSIYSEQIGSYKAQDLILSAVDDTSSIKLQNTARSGSSLEVNADEIIMASSHGFEVNHPKTGKTIFKLPGAREEMVAPPGKYTTLQASTITTSMVNSDTGQDLNINSEKTVTLQGNEGLILNSKQIDLIAETIELRPQAGMVLQGGPDHGIYINTTLLDKSDGSTANKATAATYKLCVCEVSGLVFRVQAGQPHPCAKLDAAQNPCLL